MPTFDTLLSLVLDFDFNTSTREDTLQALRAWVSEYAPDLADAVLVTHDGPTGGAAVVQLVGTADALWAAAHTWGGGDDALASEALAEARLV